MKTLLIHPEFKRLGKWRVPVGQLWRSPPKRSPSPLIPANLSLSYARHSVNKPVLKETHPELTPGRDLVTVYNPPHRHLHGNLGHFFFISPCRSFPNSDAQRTMRKVCVVLHIYNMSPDLQVNQAPLKGTLTSPFFLCSSDPPFVLQLNWSSRHHPFQLHSLTISSWKLTNSKLIVIGANQHCLVHFWLFWFLV